MSDGDTVIIIEDPAWDCFHSHEGTDGRSSPEFAAKIEAAKARQIANIPQRTRFPLFIINAWSFRRKGHTFNTSKQYFTIIPNYISSFIATSFEYKPWAVVEDEAFSGAAQGIEIRYEFASFPRASHVS